MNSNDKTFAIAIVSVVVLILGMTWAVVYIATH